MSMKLLYNILLVRYVFCFDTLHGKIEDSFVFKKVKISEKPKSSIFLGIVSKQRLYEQRHEISNNVVCATSKGSDQHAHTRSLIRAFASRLNILRVLSY